MAPVSQPALQYEANHGTAKARDDDGAHSGTDFAIDREDDPPREVSDGE